MEPAEIETRANEILLDAGISIAPVNPARIAEHEGIQIFTTEFDDSSISGVFRRTDSGSEIYIGKNIPGNRARFTVAHELAHHFLHSSEIDSIVDHDVNLFRRSGSEGDSDEKVREVQANMLAASMLMPENLVREAFAKTQDIQELAKRFQVSEDAIGWRLVNLDL